MKRLVGQVVAVGHDHVVEQDAVVGLADLHLGLHGPGGEPDLVADDLPAGRQLEVHPGPLHRVGVVDRHVGVLERRLADGLGPGTSRLVATGQLGHLLGRQGTHGCSLAR